MHCNTVSEALDMLDGFDQEDRGNLRFSLRVPAIMRGPFRHQVESYIHRYQIGPMPLESKSWLFSSFHFELEGQVRLIRPLIAYVAQLEHTSQEAVA